MLKPVGRVDRTEYEPIRLKSTDRDYTKTIRVIDLNGNRTIYLDSRYYLNSYDSSSSIALSVEDAQELINILTRLVND